MTQKPPPVLEPRDPALKAHQELPELAQAKAKIAAMEAANMARRKANADAQKRFRARGKSK